MKKTNICLIFCVIIIAVLIFFIVKPPIDGGGGPRGKDYGLTVTEYKNRLKNAQLYDILTILNQHYNA